jgi:hypothetical protein
MSNFRERLVACGLESRVPPVLLNDFNDLAG